MNKMSSMPVKKNEIIEITISDFAVDGTGIGHFQGLAIFVPLSVPNDQLSVKILKVTKNCAYGKIVEILQPSLSRIEPDCPVFTKCGGCHFRHITYEKELQFKEKRVSDTLQRIGGLHAVPMESIVGSENRNRYRNKCLLPVGMGQQVEMGFYAPHSHRIVDCNDCLLQPIAFRELMGKLRQFIEKYKISIYNEVQHTGLIRKLFLRTAEATGEIMICIVINGKMLPYEKELVQLFTLNTPAVKSIVVNTNTQQTNVALGNKNRLIYGKETIEDILCGLSFSISPLSFYQVNRTQAERLYQKAGEYAQLTGQETLLDLYCGTGTIGLSLSRQAKHLIGIEIIPDAVENAKNNALHNKIENATFHCGDAASAITLLKQENIHPDVVIVDPPRKGCSQETLDLIAELKPQRIVYISCDPATLARDIKSLVPKGYEVSAVTPFDLFPATSHVETVVLLSACAEGKTPPLH